MRPRSRVLRRDEVIFLSRVGISAMGGILSVREAVRYALIIEKLGAEEAAERLRRVIESNESQMSPLHRTPCSGCGSRGRCFKDCPRRKGAPK